MAPEHLLATFAIVCAEILAASPDGMLCLEDVTGQSVLQDAFIILSSKEIKIQSNRVSSSEAADVEEEGGDNRGALLYDMQKYKSTKARSTTANYVASMQRSGAYNSPADTKVSNSSALKSKLPKKLKSDTKVASAVADALAAATARSMLREVNKGASTPPLNAMGVPKLKSCTREVLEK